MYLPLAFDQEKDLRDINTTLEEGAQLTQLEKKHAPLVTAIFWLTLHRILNSEEKCIQQGLYTCFQQSIEAALTYFKERNPFTPFIIKTLEKADALASSMQFQNLPVARDTLYEFRHNHLRNLLTPFEHDPLEFLFVILVALQYGSENPQITLQLIVNSGGDTDTIAAIAGLLLGSYYGLHELLESNLTSELSSVTEFADFFELNLYGNNHWSKPNLSGQNFN